MNDDLTALLVPPPGPAVGFRQGLVLSFNLFSGANQISVGDAVLTDVPFLNAGTFSPIQAGDVVVLIRMRSSWAILGRVVVPGGVKAIGRYTEVSGIASSGTQGNFGISTTPTVQASVTVPVPVWAEVATVSATLMLLVRNSTAAADFLNGRINTPGGTFTGWTSGTVDAGEWGSLTVGAHHQLLVTPGGTMTVDGYAWTTTASWATNASNSACLQLTVNWNSNDG